MPTYVSGNLWSEMDKADVILVSTNAIVRQDNDQLVMGAGAAKEARDRFPGIAAYFGKRLIEMGGAESIYGVLLADEMTSKPIIGTFQVKIDYKDPALPELVAYSTGMLQIIAEDYDRIAMNFPARGLGKLSPDAIRAIISPLPKHVIIYSHERENTE